MSRTRIVWGVTGAGDFLAESLLAAERIQDEMGIRVTAVLSANAVLVAKWYKLWDELTTRFDKTLVEKGPNQPFLAGPLQTGRYSLFYVSPASANTTAKISHGIADTLITNCVAQAVKGGTPVYIYPVDQKPGSVATRIPGGDTITIRTRRIDLENVERLRNMEGITVLNHPGDIEAIANRLRVRSHRSRGPSVAD